jgi:hypothetical protein
VAQTFFGTIERQHSTSSTFSGRRKRPCRRGGMSQVECASKIGVPARTVGREVARMKRGGKAATSPRTTKV